MHNKKNKVLIPMAGLGSRFKKAGYSKAKPFIDINGDKLIDIVLDNITPADCEEVILVSLERDNAKSENLKLKNKNAKLKIIEIDKPTDGTLRTILAAENEIKDCSLILANCDQKINFNVDDFIEYCDDYDGGLITFTSQNPHHSYIETRREIITNIIEKEVISDQAVSGVYYIKDANKFIEAAKIVTESNKKQKGEFYVSSALKLLINQGLKLLSYEAESIMLGTPEELTSYLRKNE
jgi:NDP-sugar pyrophosphorylase family protein